MAVTIEEGIFEASGYLGEHEQGRFILALVRYGINGTMPDSDEPWYPLFIASKAQIDLSSNPGRQLAHKHWNKHIDIEEVDMEEVKESLRKSYRAAHKKYYAPSTYAINHNKRWSYEEDRAVLAMEVPDAQLVERLGRSLGAIHNRRLKLRNALGANDAD